MGRPMFSRTKGWRPLAALVSIVAGFLLGAATPARAAVLAEAILAGPGSASGPGAVAATLALPAVAGLLFALGVLLLAAEALTAHLTGLGVVGLGLLTLVLWTQASAGGGRPWALALVAAGLALLALEAFVIPGFGIAGVAGLAALLGGLYVAVAGSPGDVGRGIAAVVGAALGLVGGGATLLRALPRLAAGRGLVLGATAGDSAPPAGFAHPDTGRDGALVGCTGAALTDLRPGGFALIDGRRIDVITRGEGLPAGARVQVVADEGYRRIVRGLGPDEEPAEL